MTEPTHGEPATYYSGCRCPACRAAGKLKRDEGTYEAYLAGKTRRPPLFMPYDRTVAFDPDDLRHGKLSSYTAGCRDTWCLEVGKTHREYKKLGLKLPKSYNSRFPETQV